MAEAQPYSHPSLDLAAWQEADQDASVLLVDGHNVKLVTRSAHLSVTDGPPRQGRERRIARQPRKHTRAVILSGHGYVTLEAMRWLHSAGIPWTVFDPYGPPEVIAMSSPAREDPALLRAQCAAAGNGTGLEITRHLLSTKVLGQAKVIHDLLPDAGTEKYLHDRAEDIKTAESITAAMSYEGKAATAYWARWADRVAVPWNGQDKQRIPEHWHCFKQRASFVHEYETGARGASANKDATDPVNAILGYLYKLAESQAIIMCQSVGLSPVVGIAHTDRLGRASMALDILEVVRPVCDRIALSLLAPDGEVSQAFDRRWVSEGVTGIVRLLPPLTHMLCSHTAEIASAILPHATKVVKMLSGSLAVRPAGRKLSGVTEHRGYPKANLVPGTKLTDIIPDALWSQIAPILPERPYAGVGAHATIPERDFVACLVARFIVGAPWRDLPRSLSRTGMLNRLKAYQDAGVWDKIVQLVTDAGHLSALTS
jgi:CRISP-associated protein Cas1